MRIVIALLLLCSVAFAKSQPPVVMEVNANVDAVKAATVQLATADGYTIDNEGQFQIVFAKNITGKAGFMSSMLVTPPACSSIAPRYVMTVMFVPGQNIVTLRSTMEYEHPGPLCRPVRSTLDSKNIHQYTENFFQKIKAKSEQTTATNSEGNKLLVGTKENSEAAKSSPAAAAALAEEGHALTPQELADAVKAGRASKCAVVTSPVGAEIFIDGNKAGVSPLTFVLLKRDAPRTITVKLAGYKTVEKQFDPDGKVIPLGLTLEKEQ